MRKTLLSGLILIGLVIFGFVSLFRGCLAKYDERSALPQALNFSKDSLSIIFSIVKFEKATSYSSNGGFTTKSVSISYFIQTNDARTGKKIADKKIKEHTAIKSHPVETIAPIHGQAWIFMGELMAFDPFTMDKLVDTKILENKSPALKGQFPSERKYYVYNEADQSFAITMKNGSRWKLDTRTLAMSATDEEVVAEGESPELIALQLALKKNMALQDTLMEQKLRRPSRMLASRQIMRTQYEQLFSSFSEERNRLGKSRDSLQAIMTSVEKNLRTATDMMRAIANLRQKTNIYFGQMKSNMDSLEGKWYGMYTKQELDKLYNKFQYQPAYEETARRQLFAGNYATDKYGDYIIEKENARIADAGSYFLDGGFLLDKNTARPIQLQHPLSLLIVHKDQVGTEGRILLSRVSIDGKISWTVSTQLKAWTDWMLSADHIYIFGTDNKAVSSGDITALYGFDLSSGKAFHYDYFYDKLKKD